MNTAKVWIDGSVVDECDARIPVKDHGFLYGDGIFEGLRIRGRRIFRLEDHLDRFEVAARAIALELPGGRDALREIVLETARAFGADEAYARLIVTRGVGALGVDPASCPEPRVICLVDQISIYPAEKLARGIDLVTASWRRPPADVLDPRVTSLNYLNNTLAVLEAKQRGADDALLLNAAGTIAEAAVANVFALRDGELLTPPGTDGALEGITRRTVLEIAPELGIRARVATLGRFDLFAAEEFFLTGSGAGIVPVRSLDGRKVGRTSDAQPARVSDLFRDAIEQRAGAMGTPF